jgi:hypothetical protein
MQSVYQRCRRLIGSGRLPERAGKPTQIVLHLDLDRLRGLPGAQTKSPPQTCRPFPYTQTLPGAAAKLSPVSLKRS